MERYLVSFKCFKLLFVEAELNKVTGLCWETHENFCLEKGCSRGTISSRLHPYSRRTKPWDGKTDVHAVQFGSIQNLESALAELPLLAQGLACNVISSDQRCTASQQSWVAQVQHWANSPGQGNTPTAQPEALLWLLALAAPTVTSSSLHFWGAKGTETQLPTCVFCFLADPTWLKQTAFLSPLNMT